MIISSILFISALLGGLSVFIVKRDNTKLLKLILAFSGSYIFAITILHLIPDTYNAGDEKIGLYVLGGFLFQLLLEQFSAGVEHGHLHPHKNGDHQEHEKYLFPVGVMASLCLHAFLEGMPLAGEHGNYLLFGIAIHHIPAAFALGTLLLRAQLSNRRTLMSLILFAAMSPLGYLLSEGIKSHLVIDISQYFDKIMAVVVGIFLHISTTILFESSTKDHRYNRQKIVAVLLGVLISLLNFLFGHSH
ncbi:ZIP family metal transporter [Albibacterium profundi]|uniref:ZIP family metal transporter n=1 Tax=Albibacterium profundi TaxID=3134906 RepID=A0ABV5CE96_9SPHI